MFTSPLVLVALGLCFTFAKAGVACYGVMCVHNTIDPAECKTTQICATLYIYDSDEETLGSMKGTLKKGNFLNVAKVQQTGTGCYQIFKHRNFKGDYVTLTHQNKEPIIDFTRIQ
jgi:hypothetical protein